MITKAGLKAQIDMGEKAIKYDKKQLVILYELRANARKKRDFQKKGAPIDHDYINELTRDIKRCRRHIERFRKDIKIAKKKLKGL